MAYNEISIATMLGRSNWIRLNNDNLSFCVYAVDHITLQINKLGTLFFPIILFLIESFNSNMNDRYLMKAINISIDKYF